VTWFDGTARYDNAKGGFVLSEGFGFKVRTSGFAELTVESTGGEDSAYYVGSAAAQKLVGSPTEATFEGDGYVNIAVSFPEVYAIAKGGVDEAHFTDSAEKDRFTSTWTYARMAGPGYFFRAVRFEDVLAESSGGGDVANFNGSPYYDMLDGTPGETSMMLGYDAATGSGRYQHRVRNFLAVRAFSTEEGQNEAYLHNYNPETDTFVEDGDNARLYNHRFSISLEAFDMVHAEPADAALLAPGAPASASATTEAGLAAIAVQQLTQSTSDDNEGDDDQLAAVDAAITGLSYTDTDTSA
jgi:hypothetical protein